MDDNLSPIQSFYAGKTIFVTGASGFMGKVLLEKLLWACSDLKRIYILLRSKRGRTPENRVEDMFKLPLFDRIRKSKPQMMKKITALPGDITLENLGLVEAQRNILINEVAIVFHFAATLRLEAKLIDAIVMNTVGTASVIELTKEMKKLEILVHLSTAFCHVDQNELGERIYDAPHDPEEIIRLSKWIKPEILDLMTPQLIEPHPNTYTYTKRLAESLVAKEYPDLPCVIVRPSIVTPAWQEPLPGWVDNLNGPVGLIVGAGKGVIRSMHCNGEYKAEVIPVDVAISATIAIAHKVATATARPKELPVYNVTQSGVIPITWGEVIQKGKKIAHENPFEGAIWYPDGDIRSSKVVHTLVVFFFQLIPAYFIDFLMIIFRQKRFMVRIQKRITDGLEVLQYFTTRDWLFNNANLLKLWHEMHPKDKKLFPIDFLAIDELEYMKNIILGARQYCMKEKLETLPRARRHQSMLYVIHLIAIYGFYYFIISTMIKNFEFAKHCLDFFTEKVKVLPIVGPLVEKIA